MYFPDWWVLEGVSSLWRSAGRGVLVRPTPSLSASSGRDSIGCSLSTSVLSRPKFSPYTWSVCWQLRWLWKSVMSASKSSSWNLTKLGVLLTNQGLLGLFKQTYNVQTFSENQADRPCASRSSRPQSSHYSEVSGVLCEISRSVLLKMGLGGATSLPAGNLLKVSFHGHHLKLADSQLLRMGSWSQRDLYSFSRFRKKCLAKWFPSGFPLGSDDWY